MKSYFKFSKEDLISSFTLVLISLPISAGIAIASKAPAEAGIITAICGALFIGLFTSSPRLVYGPAAGLSVFVSAGAVALGGFEMIGPAIILSGVWLVLLSVLKAHRIVNIFPTMVVKGMAAGIGLILILKMIPHLLGYDDASFLNDQFFSEDGRNTLSEIIYSFKNLHPGALIISLLSFFLIGILSRMRSTKTIWVIGLGIVLNEILKLTNPEWALSGEHVLNVNRNGANLKIFSNQLSNWWMTVEISLIIMAVIVLEGLATLDIFQKLDPRHSRINFKKELLLMGMGNIAMGIIGALPLMPVLIRSKANVEFGARNRSSVLMYGVWLLIALFAGKILSIIPMASVAVLLMMVGVNLIDFKLIKKVMVKGVRHSLPFFVTLGMILFFNLLWGILAGLIMGVILSIQSMIHRTMVLVNDEENYLLKFYKDVSIFNKAELRETLEKIPEGKDILIDGTGNISIDEEIENYLEDFVRESHDRGTKVTFVKSNLAVSTLFKAN